MDPCGVAVGTFPLRASADAVEFRVGQRAVDPFGPGLRQIDGRPREDSPSFRRLAAFGSPLGGARPRPLDRTTHEERSNRVPLDVTENRQKV